MAEVSLGLFVLEAMSVGVFVAATALVLLVAFGLGAALKLLLAAVGRVELCLVALALGLVALALGLCALAFGLVALAFSLVALLLSLCALGRPLLGGDGATVSRRDVARGATC